MYRFPIILRNITAIDRNHSSSVKCVEQLDPQPLCLVADASRTEEDHLPPALKMGTGSSPFIRGD